MIYDDPPAPCEIAQDRARKMDTLYAMCKADSVLATIPNLATETKEKVFPIFRKFFVSPTNNTDTTFTNHYKTGIVQTGTDSNFNIQFDMPYRTILASMLHTHPPSGYSAQSPDDVYRLIENQLESRNFIGTFVVASNGSKYALNVTDLTQAATFYNTQPQFLNGSKWNENSAIGVAFKAATLYYEKIYKGSPNQANLAYEMAMSAVLNQFNTGVTLSKQDTTGKFKPIIVKTAPNPNKPRKKIYIQECL